MTNFRAGRWCITSIHPCCIVTTIYYFDPWCTCEFRRCNTMCQRQVQVLHFLKGLFLWICVNLTGYLLWFCRSENKIEQSRRSLVMSPLARKSMRWSRWLRRWRSAQRAFWSTPNTKRKAMSRENLGEMERSLSTILCSSSTFDLYFLWALL